MSDASLDDELRAAASALAEGLRRRYGGRAVDPGVYGAVFPVCVIGDDPVRYGSRSRPTSRVLSGQAIAL